ncbi:hypothetical protein BTUL_0043g00310 [Botrytis tulipae]|uniref:Uncharacterized protein n=1 Tax=Botrytis tulipae TaxID=87230 RepID=A0A4Z1EVY9_9HELO|nr:hypothetical protein BTUL_0043g00310 [Botrytis tulipae]
MSLLDGLNQFRQLGLVLGANLSKGENSSGLLVDDRAESGLTLDDGVWDTHLLAQSWKEDNQLNWVNIVRDEDQRGLLSFDQTNNVVKTVLDGVWLLANVFLLLSLLDGGGLLQETLLLLRLGLWAVLVEELEGLGGGVAVENVLELSDRRWDLQSHVQDLLLALKTDILGPLHHTGKISSGLDVLTDTEVTVFGWTSERGWNSRTLAAFFDPAPALDWGNGAGAAFFPDFGGCH